MEKPDVGFSLELLP